MLTVTPWLCVLVSIHMLPLLVAGQAETEPEKMIGIFTQVMKAFETGKCDNLAPHFALGSSKKTFTAILNDPWQENRYVKGRDPIIKKCKREWAESEVQSARFQQDFLVINGICLY
jgi:hypothetical protein